MDDIRKAPTTVGRVDLIVRRPALGEREVLEEGLLSLDDGLIGDTWNARPSRRTEDGSPHPDMQLNLVMSRVVGLIAQETERWPLAGDQLYVDLDLSQDNLPSGTRLALGTAVIEVTAQPHTGCAKFTQRFGLEAFRWVNTEAGQKLRLRGMNAKVVQAGVVRPGEAITKLAL